MDSPISKIYIKKHIPFLINIVKMHRVILVILLLILFTISGFSENYYVKTSGDNNDNGTTPSTAWATISYAGSQNLKQGDTVFVAPGEYEESIEITHSGNPNKPIVYYADTSGNRFGMSEGEVLVKASFNISTKNIQIYYFSFEGSSRAINLTDSKSILIQGINAELSSTAIYSDNSGKDLTIKNCHLTQDDNNTNLLVLDSKNNIDLDIKNNHFEDGNIQIQNSKVDSIANNEMSDIDEDNQSVNALYLTNSECNYIIGNDIHNISSLALRLDNTSCSYIANNDIRSISSVDGNGIGIYGSDDSNTIENIINNRFSDINKYAISINSTSGNISIKKNIITSAGGGIRLTSGNNFTSINITNNTISRIGGDNSGISINNSGSCDITNNLIYNKEDTSSNRGIYVIDNSDTDLKNNTIHNMGGKGLYGRIGGGNWKNNIITGNNIGIYVVSNFNANLSYNCLYNNDSNYGRSADPGTGAINKDPLYVNPGNDDFHIQSTFGSYHGGDWLDDPAFSPCIDAGDPADDYGNEPKDNGGRINMGAYGNTAQASLSGEQGEEEKKKEIVRGKWMFLGAPLQPQNRSLEAVFGDDFNNPRPYTITDTDTTWNQWALIRWETDDSTSEYFSFGDGTQYQPPECKVGRGYFIYQDEREQVTVDVEGSTVDSDVIMDISAKPDNDWYPPAFGYNMFANPFPKKVNMASFRIINSNTGTEYTIPEAADSGWISPYLITWNHNKGRYEYTAFTKNNKKYKLKPWRGFWLVQLTISPDLKLKMPASGVQGNLTKKTRIARKHTSHLQNLGYKYNLRKSAVNNDWEWFLKFGIISEDKKLQDLENYIGTSDAAITSSDTLDPWDIIDFSANARTGKKSSKVNTENIELGIKKDERLYAYELHNSGFSDQTEWKLKVVNKSDKSNFRFIWPHINQVPQGIEFSLLDDSKKTLIKELRSRSGYNISLSKGSDEFYIVARKVKDTSPPKYSFNVRQNNYLENHITVYITPSEPLKKITAKIDSQEIELNQLNSPPNVYYFDYTIQNNKLPDMVIKGTDYSNNQSQSNFSNKIEVKNTVFNQNTEINNKQYSILLKKGSVDKETTILGGRYPIGVTYPNDMDSIGDPVAIKAQINKFQKPVLLSIDDVKKPNADLFKYSRNKWKYVTEYSDQMQIEEPGIYSLFSSDKNFQTDSLNGDDSFKLLNPYPNPFNSTINIKYELPQEARIKVVIYNLLGKKIKTLYNEYQKKGIHNCKWYGNNQWGESVSSGVYFLKITSPDQNYNEIKKLTYIK